MNTHGRYLNFGAGDPVEGWVNLDPSPLYMLPRFMHAFISPWYQRSRYFLNTSYQYYRFTTGRSLPFTSGTLKAIYCSHVLEHLPAASIPSLLVEFHRILSHGGVVRIIVPDLKTAFKRSLRNGEAWLSLDDILGTLPLGITRSRMRAIAEGIFSFPSVHRTLLVPEYLEQHLGDNWKLHSGLAFLDSFIDIKRLTLVEREDRFQNAIVFELERCLKKV